MFTKESIQLLRKDLETILSEVEKDYDITISIGNISYDTSSASMTIKCFQGSPGESERAEFEKHCFSFDYLPADYKRIVEFNGRRYEFIGFETSARKYKYLIRNIKTGVVTRTSKQCLHFVY